MNLACIALCKNEEKNIESFLANLKLFNITDVYVLDTGSTDRSIQLLQEKEVNVFEKAFTPFDFSKARNHLRDLIPQKYDFLVHLDLDERIKSLPNLGHYEGQPCCISGIRHELLYGTISQSMTRISGVGNYEYIYPVHEKLCSSDPIFRDDQLVLTHSQSEVKDRYENLTEQHYQNYKENLFYHYCQDLYRQKRYAETAQIFLENCHTENYYSLNELQKWQVTRNYQMSLIIQKFKPDEKYFEIFKKYLSYSSLLYLSFFYFCLSEKETSKQYYEKLNLAQDADLNQLFYNKHIQATVEKYVLGKI